MPKKPTAEVKRIKIQKVLHRIEDLKRKADTRARSVIYQSLAGPAHRANERQEAEEIVRLKNMLIHLQQV